MHAIMDHIVLNVRDIDRMLTFYTDIMQFSPERLDEFRQGTVSFPSIRLNEQTIIDLFEDDAERQGSNLNHFCIALSKADWDALLQRLQQAGIALDGQPASRWGAQGDATAVSFPDPEGNNIEARFYD